MYINKLKDRAGTRFKIKIKKENLKAFCSVGQNRLMYADLGEIWEVYWSEERGNFLTTNSKHLMCNWYITEYELKTYFELWEEPILDFTDKSEKLGTIILEKAVVINDMRVTSENMEAFFEKVRKMLA